MIKTTLIFKQPKGPHWHKTIELPALPNKDTFISVDGMHFPVDTIQLGKDGAVVGIKPDLTEELLYHLQRSGWRQN